MGRIEDINWLNETLDGYTLEACRGRLVLKRGDEIVSELNASHRLVNNVLWRLRRYGYGLRDLLLLADEVGGEVSLRDCSRLSSAVIISLQRRLVDTDLMSTRMWTEKKFLCGSCNTANALDMLETFLVVSSKRAVRTKKNVGVGHMYVDCISEIYG